MTKNSDTNDTQKNVVSKDILAKRKSREDKKFSCLFGMEISFVPLLRVPSTDGREGGVGKMLVQ